MIDTLFGATALRTLLRELQAHNLAWELHESEVLSLAIPGRDAEIVASNRSETGDPTLWRLWARVDGADVDLFYMCFRDCTWPQTVEQAVALAADIHHGAMELMPDVPIY